MKEYNLKKLPSIFNEDKDVLAAASLSTEIHTVVSTFIDDEKNFLLKIVQFKNSSKLFLFTSEKNNLEHITLSIPQYDLTYQLADTTNPIVVGEKVDPENCKIILSN